MFCGKELALISALWMCAVVYNALNLSSIRKDQYQLVKTWPQSPAEVNNIASNRKHQPSASSKTISKRVMPPPHADDHPICSDNTAETILAGSEHWHIAAADAEISMYPLGGGTLGVQITSLSSKSEGVMRSFAGRVALQKQQAELLRGSAFVSLHEMSEDHHEHKAPDYDQYLGCGDGQTPAGTAVLVVESFHGGQMNLWHSLANHHGIWLLLQVLGVSPSDVTAILPKKYGTPFQYPPRFVSDVLWPMHINTNTISSQRNCFEKLIFMETNSSPYWSLRFIKETCSAESPYMKMHQQFHEEAREAALRVIGLEQNIAGNKAKQPKVCYMSRRLRPKRKRHFSKSFEEFMDNKLNDWATRYGNSIEFQRLEFDESVPFAMQVQQSAECSILFGVHGAGLGHMIWMESGAQVIEIGNHMGCETYYKSMAKWYGHLYACFSELEGHKIKYDRNQVYHFLNVTLLLNVLDEAIVSHHI